MAGLGDLLLRPSINYLKVYELLEDLKMAKCNKPYYSLIPAISVSEGPRLYGMFMVISQRSQHLEGDIHRLNVVSST